MNIKKIKLIGNGLCGMHVTYLKEEDRNGRPFIREVIEKPKHPIHFALEKLFKDLRYHLLDITQLIDADDDKKIKDYFIEETSVTEVEFDAMSFSLKGEKKRFGDKYIYPETCKVQEEDLYEHFDTVMSIINSVCEETKEYLAGTKKVEDEEVIRRWIQTGKSKDLTEEALTNYSPEQLREFATRIIESKFGGIVLLDSEADISDMNVEDVNEEINQAQVVEEVSTEVEITGEETIIPIPEKKEKKKKVKEEAPIEVKLEVVTPIVEPQSQMLPPAF